MQKELNPELFSPDSRPGQSADLRRNPQDVDGLGSRTPFRQQLENQHWMQGTEEKMAELRLQIKLVQEKLASVVSQANEFIKASQARMDRNHQLVKTHESNTATALQDVLAKLSHVHHRLNERRNVEQKIQELVDRHNSVLRSYEVRMSQMQRLLSEKETQFAQSMSQLNELKMELARLKRM